MACASFLTVALSFSSCLTEEWALTADNLTYPVCEMCYFCRQSDMSCMWNVLILQTIWHVLFVLYVECDISADNLTCSVCSVCGMGSYCWQSDMFCLSCLWNMFCLLAILCTCKPNVLFLLTIWRVLFVECTFSTDILTTTCPVDGMCSYCWQSEISCLCNLTMECLACGIWSFCWQP